MRVGVDIDGVLADFNRSFIERVIEVTGKDLFPPRPFDIPCWQYPAFYGYTQAEEGAVWESVKADERFWFLLMPYPGIAGPSGFVDKLRLFGYDNDLYFITSRPGVFTKSQSEMWLSNQSSYGRWRPTVLISSEKGMCAKALLLDRYIDDRWENCMSVVDRAPECAVYLLDRPWNQNHDHPGIVRITNVNCFLP